MLYAHTRDIFVRVFPTQVIYEIPIYKDHINNKLVSIEYGESSIILTLGRAEPPGVRIFCEKSLSPVITKDGSDGYDETATKRNGDYRSDWERMY
jgi:hypothetical protein